MFVSEVIKNLKCMKWRKNGFTLLSIESILRSLVLGHYSPVLVCVRLQLDVLDKRLVQSTKPIFLQFHSMGNRFPDGDNDQHLENDWRKTWTSVADKIKVVFDQEL